MQPPCLSTGNEDLETYGDSEVKEVHVYLHFKMRLDKDKRL